MFERDHLFNPFKLQTDTDEELAKVINDLASQYKSSTLPQDIVFNINLEADLLMIYGEFIARLAQESSLLKLQNDAKEDKLIYQLRSDYAKTSSDKMAIKYFEAQAGALMEEERQKQYKKEAMLKRFKQAYTSLETKQNALKKQLEMVKYE